MVVAGLHPQGKGLARGPRGFDQQLRLQLVREEGIGVALVNQDVVEPALCGPGGAQQGDVVAGPGAALGTQIGGQGLLAPGAAGRLAIGAKADTERNRSGWLSARVRAPWPPMEWPEIDRVPVVGNARSMSGINSSPT